jgi:hypothetical protein
VFWVRCIAPLDLVRVGASGLLERGVDGKEETELFYTLLIYTNGDVDAECSAAIGSQQAGSEAVYYPEITNGASSGACVANAEFPGTAAAGAAIGEVVGYWSFAIDAALPRAAYVDADNPLGLNGFGYSFTEKDCNATMLGDNGKWTKVTLADVF